MPKMTTVELKHGDIIRVLERQHNGRPREVKKLVYQAGGGDIYELRDPERPDQIGDVYDLMTVAWNYVGHVNDSQDFGLRLAMAVAKFMSEWYEQKDFAPAAGIIAKYLVDNDAAADPNHITLLQEEIARLADRRDELLTLCQRNERILDAIAALVGRAEARHVSPAQVRANDIRAAFAREGLRIRDGEVTTR